MKLKFLITSLLLATLVIGGCSANSTPHDNASMNHSDMSHDMANTGAGHGSHTNPLQLNNSTGENEIALPSLLQPEQKEGNTFNISAQQGTTEIFDDIQTETYGYNGSFLGPVIRLNKGDDVKLRTMNELQETTTFHWHGLDVPGVGDGGPHHLVKPGETKEVSFTVEQGAATLWFHPHPEGATASQVYKGLAGLIYIEDENSQRLGLPTEYGVNDFPLIFQDRQFNKEKQFNYDEIANPDGTLGDTLLVNGTLNPRLSVGREKIRLRLLNGSNARNYTFKLNTSDSFQQIATDGGFLNEPTEMSAITLTPGERAEILIDFSKYNASSDIALIDEEGTILLPFVIKDQEAAPTELSESLNSFTVTESEKKLPATKKIELFGMGEMVSINGKQFDKDRIDFTQKQGETEIWEIYNKPDMMGGMTHPFHIHGTQFKIVSIDGEEPPADLQGWKDTVSIEAGQTVKLAVKFHHKGTYMFHCHILEHEENGMMGQIKVI